jgi:hypothetical protein
MLKLGQPMTADLFFSDDDIRRMSDLSVSKLFACYPFPGIWRFMKIVHQLIPDRFRAMEWASIVRCAATNDDYEFLDSIKEYVQKLLDSSPNTDLLIAQLRTAICTPLMIAKLFEWFATNFPASCEVVAAVLHASYNLCAFPQSM